jgi:hypothetical protein
MAFYTSIIAQELNLVLENDKCNQRFSVYSSEYIFYGWNYDLKLLVCIFVNNKNELCGGFRFGF